MIGVNASRPNSRRSKQGDRDNPTNSNNPPRRIIGKNFKKLYSSGSGAGGQNNPNSPNSPEKEKDPEFMEKVALITLITLITHVCMHSYDDPVITMINPSDNPLMITLIILIILIILITL